jgi:hypothetical protein
LGAELLIGEARNTLPNSQPIHGRQAEIVASQVVCRVASCPATTLAHMSPGGLQAAWVGFPAQLPNCSKSCRNVSSANSRSAGRCVAFTQVAAPLLGSARLSPWLQRTRRWRVLTPAMRAVPDPRRWPSACRSFWVSIRLHR